MAKRRRTENTMAKRRTKDKQRCEKTIHRKFKDRVPRTLLKSAINSTVPKG